MPESIPTPETIGKYKILQELGHGGMGIVYLAKHETLRRHVAIKMMLPSTARNKAARARFLREARAMATIKSPHVVTVYDVEDDDQPYFVMEFLQGTPLDKLLLRPRRLPLKSILNLCIDFAQGIADAHAEGIIHRDIKPANLFVESPKNRGKVLDFGLTRINENTHLTNAGTVMGTPTHMPLEQAEGKPVDHRADIYSLGVVFYQLCTGKLPFDGESVVQIVTAIMTREPKRVEALNGDIPKVFADLIHRMLKKDLLDRPRSMEEVLQVLTALRGERSSSNVEVPDMPPPLPEAEIVRDTESGSYTRNEGPRRSGSRSGSRTAPMDPDTPWLKYVIFGLIPLLVIGVVVLLLTRGSSSDPEKERAERAKLAEADRLRKIQEDYDQKLKNLEAESKQSTAAERQRFQEELERLKQEKEEAEQKRKEFEQKAKQLVKKKPELLDCTGPKGADELTVLRAQREWAEYLGVEVETSVDLGGGLKMAFVLVPPGKFVMGATDHEGEIRESESPAHTVTITKPFYLAKYEVTQEEYTQLTGRENPSMFKTDFNSSRYPVENVSWFDTEAAWKKLSTRTLPRGFVEANLPTEAQWEYACRAGTRTIFYFGDRLNGDRANTLGRYPFGTTVQGKSLDKTCAVDSKDYPPNAFGLCHMSGNVWEWCRDRWDGSAYRATGRTDPFVDSPNITSRVRRGGSWADHSVCCRAAYRIDSEPDSRYEFGGFRLVLLP